MNKRQSLLTRFPQGRAQSEAPSTHDISLSSSLSPSDWAQQNFGLTLDPAQRQILESPSHRIIVNCSRQWGKSTTAALRALLFALNHPRSTTIILSPSLRQSGELLYKVASFTTQLNLKTKSDGINRLSLRFPNAARVIALPGNEHTTRGFSQVGLLIVDEASRVLDSNYLAARPFLATTNGALMLLSTPNGRRGFFYKEWTGPAPWTRITVPATQCPRISEEFLEDERRSLPAALFRQEYLCEFSGTQYHFIRPELLDNLGTTDFPALALSPRQHPDHDPRPPHVPDPNNIPAAAPHDVKRHPASPSTNHDHRQDPGHANAGAPHPLPNPNTSPATTSSRDSNEANPRAQGPEALPLANQKERTR